MNKDLHARHNLYIYLTFKFYDNFLVNNYYNLFYFKEDFLN